MMTVFSKKSRWFIALAVLYLMTVLPESVFSSENKIMINNVAMMPFFTGKKPVNAESVLDVKKERMGLAEDIDPGAEKMLTKQVQKALEKRLSDRVVPLESVMDTYNAICREQSDLTPKEQVEELAQRLGVDYVVAGNVWRFSERTGNAFSVSKPSSVAFRLHLVHIPSKTRIWTEQYDKTQQALSENIFKAKDFIRHKGKWLNAKDLSEIGVHDLVRHMPF